MKKRMYFKSCFPFILYRKFYSGENIKNCNHGLYEIFWKEGGMSLAAIGSMYDGTRWIAPTNWTADMGKDPTGKLTDELINQIHYIVLLKKSQY